MKVISIAKKVHISSVENFWNSKGVFSRIVSFLTSMTIDKKERNNIIAIKINSFDFVWAFSRLILGWYR
jgi:hypothetical protein